MLHASVHVVSFVAALVHTCSPVSKVADLFGILQPVDEWGFEEEAGQHCYGPQVEGTEPSCRHTSAQVSSCQLRHIDMTGCT